MISVAAVEAPQSQLLGDASTASVSGELPTKTEGLVFRSKLPDIDIPNHLPLHAYCFQKVEEFSDRPCLIDGACGRVYSFAETHLMCRKVAAGLGKMGVEKGDVIMVMLPNIPEFVFCFMGASMAGAVTTTANPFYTPAEIFKQLAGSGARLVVTQSQYAYKLKDAGDQLDFKVVTADEPLPGFLHFSDLLNSGEVDFPVVSTFDSEAAVAMPFSSGTTGLPKGVVLTHNSLISTTAQQVDGENPNLHLAAGDVVLCVLPLFHIFSLSILLVSVRTGAAVLLMQKYEMGRLLELVQRYRVTVTPVVPPLVLALAKSAAVEKHDLSSIRIVISGAAPLGKELEEALLSRLPQVVFGQGYGMTEAGPVLAMSLCFAKHPFPTKSGSCGTVVRNAELKVIDPATGISLAQNQRGEICIRGPQIMKGYLNDEKATRLTIDVEGWLHTGDIGYVDDDEEVFIVDRVKEIIKFKGFQVPPAELESLLVSHPSIADAAVVPQKDEAAGEVPVAFIVQSNGLDLTEEAVKDFIAKQVVFYKKLHKVFFVHAIPKSPSGKILRKELKAKLANN